MFANTVKYLKPVQIQHQILRRIVTRSPNTNPSTITLREQKSSIVDFICRPQSFYGTEEFNFFDISGLLSEIGWSGTQRNDLWRYNQHYFDDLSADPAGVRRIGHIALIDMWIEANPAGSGPGWEAYPISLRIVNWIKFYLSTTSLKPGHLNNLYTQVLWLEKNIEWHLLGNHILANAKALIFAGLFFDDSISSRWLKKGLNIYIKEIDEQILNDGGHFELSPMYHAIILEDVLDLINIIQVFSIDNNFRLKRLMVLLKRKIIRMIWWIKQMNHPDGRLPFFNDVAINIAPKLDELLGYAELLHIELPRQDFKRLTDLEESGFIIWREGQNCLIFDVGAIGPKYLPGHAHADTLSIECSINGKSLIVNSGTSDYQKGNLRSFQRSTAAHSTLTVNDTDSSEVWASFRVGRRATVSGRFLVEESQRSFFGAAHNGFMRLNGRFWHRRVIDCRSNCIIIKDEVQGQVSGNVKIYYYLAPTVKAKKIDQSRYQLINDQKMFSAFVNFSATNVKLEASYWLPEFGKKIKNLRFVICYDGDFPKDFESKITW